jgi:hypothetical protein
MAFTPTKQELEIASALGVAAPTSAAQAAQQATSLQIAQEAQVLGGGTTAGGTSLTLPGGGTVNVPGTTSTAVPVVPSTKGTGVVPFALPNTKLDFTPNEKFETKAPSGETSMTYQDVVQQLYELAKDPEALKQVQQQMFAAGLYTSKNWSKYGTLDKATQDAWEQLATTASESGVPMMGLLFAGKNMGRITQAMSAVQEAISSAQLKASQVQNATVDLTDPNKVAQQYAAAKEEMGEGVPSKEEVAKFVQAFINGPQGEIAAVRNEDEMAKQNELAGAGDLEQARTDLESGNLALANKAANTPGPVEIATKAMPDLDAEAMAQAKADNPAQYLATQASYMGGILNNMLSGPPSYQTRPEVPSANAPGGAVLSTPLVGG